MGNDYGYTTGPGVHDGHCNAEKYGDFFHELDSEYRNLKNDWKTFMGHMKLTIKDQSNLWSIKSKKDALKVTSNALVLLRSTLNAAVDYGIALCPNNMCTKEDRNFINAGYVALHEYVAWIFESTSVTLLEIINDGVRRAAGVGYDAITEHKFTTCSQTSTIDTSIWTTHRRMT